MNDNKQKDYSELEIFSEASSMSAELRESIKQMSRYYRFDVGDELRKLLRQIKYLIADASGKIEIKGKYEAVQELLETISHIEIALQDCLEDSALSVSGRYNINQPLIRLSKIKDQATRWRNYLRDVYVRGKEQED